MKLRQLRPELERASSLEEFLSKIQFQNIMALFGEISDYYDLNVPMYQVLNSYGISEVSAYSEEVQVPCMLVEHGTSDKHNSARFFATDRETGQKRGTVYCYKCQKLLTPFWYIFKMEKDHHGLNITDVFLYIWNKFRVDFPREMLLEFDAEKFYTFDSGSSERDELLLAFKKAREIRYMKLADTQKYYGELMNLLSLG